MKFLGGKAVSDAEAGASTAKPFMKRAGPQHAAGIALEQALEQVQAQRGIGPEVHTEVLNMIRDTGQGEEQGEIPADSTDPAPAEGGAEPDAG